MLFNRNTLNGNISLYFRNCGSYDGLISPTQHMQPNKKQSSHNNINQNNTNSSADSNSQSSKKKHREHNHNHHHNHSHQHQHQNSHSKQKQQSHHSNTKPSANQQTKSQKLKQRGEQQQEHVNSIEKLSINDDVENMNYDGNDKTISENDETENDAMINSYSCATDDNDQNSNCYSSSKGDEDDDVDDDDDDDEDDVGDCNGCGGGGRRPGMSADCIDDGGDTCCSCSESSCLYEEPGMPAQRIQIIKMAQN